MARRAPLVAILATSAVAALNTGATAQTAPIHFSFRGYANDVRVIPPLVGPWQLGFARINGSGTVAGNDVSGSIFDSFQPHLGRYPAAATRAEVTGYSYYRAAHNAYTNLTLTIQITQTDSGQCAVGDQGTLMLHESAHRLRNGQRSDYIVMRWPAGVCPGLVQGWTNANGGARTSPRYGGPPHGGTWAIVSIS